MRSNLQETRLLEPTIEERALAARYGDLATYGLAVHGLTAEPYQSAWEEALNTMNRVCIVCPPDSFKSSTVQWWVEMAIGRNPNIRVLWLMNAGEQAEKRVMAVQQTLESNTVYRRAFNVQKDKAAQWTKTVLYVQRQISSPDPTLMGCGFNGPYQGLHFDVIVIDDPTNQEDVRSPTTMDIQRTKLRGVILDRLVKGGRIVAILTRWGENDLVPLMESLGFTIIKMPLVADYPWGPTLSPTRFPEEDIPRIRADKGPYLFDLTYMCTTTAPDSGPVRREHIRYWNKSSLPDHALALYMGIDPAISTKTRSDYTAIATVGMDTHTRKLYLLELWAGRLEFPSLVEEIVRRAKRTAGLLGIGIETIGFQVSVLQYLKRYHNLPLRELPYRSRRQALHRTIGIDKDKLGRALYLDNLFSTGRLYIPEDLPIVDGVSFETELTTIPNARHDDRMDAVTFACALADASVGRRQFVSIRAGLG